MTRAEIITEVKDHFSIDELVCQHVLSAFGEQSWQFFRTELLETLIVIRNILNVPITINSTGQTQRGLRCNICKLVQDKSKLGKSYLSAHVLGAAVDMTVEGISAENARKIIEHHSLELPYPIRLEQDVSWIHLDVYDMCNGNKVNWFKA